MHPHNKKNKMFDQEPARTTKKEDAITGFDMDMGQQHWSLNMYCLILFHTKQQWELVAHFRLIPIFQVI